MKRAKSKTESMKAIKEKKPEQGSEEYVKVNETTKLGTSSACWGELKCSSSVILRPSAMFTGSKGQLESTERICGF